MLFLFHPPEIFSVLVMASLVLPNMTLGITMWYIDPPMNTPPGQLRPYHALNPVQPVSNTPITAPVPPQLE